MQVYLSMPCFTAERVPLEVCGGRELDPERPSARAPERRLCGSFRSERSLEKLQVFLCHENTSEHKALLLGHKLPHFWQSEE